MSDSDLVVSLFNYKSIILGISSVIAFFIANYITGDTNWHDLLAYPLWWTYFAVALILVNLALRMFWLLANFSRHTVAII